MIPEVRKHTFQLWIRFLLFLLVVWIVDRFVPFDLLLPAVVLYLASGLFYIISAFVVYVAKTTETLNSAVTVMESARRQVYDRMKN